MNTDLQSKLNAAAKRDKSRGNRAELIIWTNVLFNAGMGMVPFGIDVWVYVGANVVTIVALGYLYGFTKNRDQAGALMKQIFSAGCIVLAASYLELRFFREVLQGEGDINLGGPTIAGMALDTVLDGAISFTVSYTAKTYFSARCILESAEIRKEFRARFEEDKAKVAAARKAKEISS